MNLPFKKVIFSIIFSSLFVCAAFTQETFEDFESASFEDDFDSLFDDVEEDLVVEEQSAPVVQTASAQSLGSLINFSGHLKADVGAALIVSDKVRPSGYFDFENVLRMKVRPSEALALNGGITTSTSNRFAFDLSYMYIDYLAFNKVYISAGKKDELLGGYTRLFEEAVIKDTSGLINIDVKYPWSTGTLTLLGAYNQYSAGIEPSYQDITLGGAIEQTIGHTSVNIFGKKYASNWNTHPAAGIEIKRTIFGFDMYAQGVAQHRDRITGTAGFYRLWDAKDPNVGINIEYRYNWTPYVDQVNTHLLMFEFGVKRLGKKKNLKFGVEGNYNFTAYSGMVKAAFLIGDMFPYANWSNGVQIDFNKDARIDPKFASVIQIALDY